MDLRSLAGINAAPTTLALPSRTKRFLEFLHVGLLVPSAKREIKNGKLHSWYEHFSLLLDSFLHVTIIFVENCRVF